MLKNILLKRLVQIQVGALCLFTFIIMGVSYYINERIEQTDEAQAQDVHFRDFMTQRYVDHLHWVDALKMHVFLGNSFDKTTDPAKCEFGKWYQEYKPTEPMEQAVYESLDEPHRALHEAGALILQTADKERKVRVYGETAMPALNVVKRQLYEYKEYLDARIMAGYEMMDMLTAWSQRITIGLLLSLCGLSIMGYFLMRRKLFIPLGAFTQVVDRVSEGDLSVDIGMIAKDEVGYLAERMRLMVANLTKMAQRISGGAQQLATASEEFSATADDLSGGSGRLSSQTDQVVTAMTEVSQTIMDMAKNASHAADASKSSSSTATEGKAVVAKVFEGMQEIAKTVQTAAVTIEELGKSSAQIGEIITVINGIADQTNLLALNAAIEAARAGEQGRGFAVVADEVRKLAERSSQATKDIAERITMIQAAAGESVHAMKQGSDKVDKGVALTREAGATLDTIVSASSKAGDMVQRIAVATEEQSAAAEEVSQNMQHIADITKQSSVATTQIKQSATGLAQLAAELKETTAWFKLNGAGK